MGQFGSGASLLKTKAIGGGRRRKRLRLGIGKKCAVAFTTTDVLSFVVKAWTEEVLRFGAPEKVRLVVKTLWARFLQAAGAAFGPADLQPGAGVKPSFRDVQVWRLHNFVDCKFLSLAFFLPPRSGCTSESV